MGKGKWEMYGRFAAVFHRSDGRARAHQTSATIGTRINSSRMTATVLGTQKSAGWEKRREMGSKTCQGASK